MSLGEHTAYARTVALGEQAYANVTWRAYDRRTAAPADPQSGSRWC